MQSKLDDVKRSLIEKAAELAKNRRGAAGLDPHTAANFLKLYYRHISAEDIAERTPVDVFGAALSQYRIAANRPQGTATVRVFTPNVDEHGWTASGHTVVEVVTDDMPFLVDSVTMELTRLDRDIHMVIHPQVLVRRDVTGALQEVFDADEARNDGGARAQDVVRESWMHIEVDRESDPDRLAAMEADLSRVLRDVREAVEDWSRMRDTALLVVDDLHENPPPKIDPAEVEEAASLLSWLVDDHFTFLGYREYSLQEVDGADCLRAVPGTGLGILRSDQDMSPSFGKLPPAVKAKARERRVLIITKANSRATVHRPTYLDYVGVKTFDDKGDVTGERRFLGLFSSAAYAESVTRIPVLRRRAQLVLEREGFEPMSHSGKALMDILENYPRDELFQTTLDELVPIADAVLHLHERRQLRLFVRRDVYGRYLSCLVYFPRDRYTTAVREKMQDILKSTLGGESIDYTPQLRESMLARLHFVVRPPQGQSIKDFDEEDLERRLAEATRSWKDDFAKEVRDQFGEEVGTQLARRYADAFPEAYKEDFTARAAAADLKRIEEVDGGDELALSLYEPLDRPAGERRFKLFTTKQPLSLSQMLPLLSEMGVEVIDERPYLLERPGSDPAYIYDFGLRYRGELAAESRQLFQEGFLAAWKGQAESDGFNRLILGGSLSWRQAMMLRAYSKYLRQGGTPFSQAYIEQTVAGNVEIARLLVKFFEVSFDPGTEHDLAADAESRGAAIEDVRSRIETALDRVASLDEDRILRSYLSVIQATLRTNYFQPGADGQPKPYVSFKLEPRAIPDLPEPRPRFEIFVYSPRVEGVHLRFGAVARGGLRWSDRREDFRTEVLGLVKAQMVKNAVIVPVGAKGGFYCKLLPDPAVDREAWLAEGVECYKTFISGLLDITDNLVAGETIPPPRVVRHDGDDTYLVVAADKGTATFSDIANGVSKAYGFWLGDAFASGGSVGYDHKAMGITARGAWESVRRHFREMGVDCQSEDFSCVGIGDMSGDVFGNGMLLSEHTRLVATFDHRHIFVDPAPDTAASFAERRRLFDLPRSSWADYDASLLSGGGFVVARTAKSIPLTDQAKEALGIEPAVDKMTPAELMRAILLAPVDLLWNGGIGTYVKAEAETNADAGDKANDAIRVNGGQLRCSCVGEGGNLGLTQLGRIEYARSGGRINTDFIDNSAGVDTSDHEVNIKILLDAVVTAGDITEKHRNELLASMTDEVGQLVLRDNYEQNIALAHAVAQAAPLLHVHMEWINRLEREGLLSREIEFLPSRKAMADLRAAGQGLTAPELSVLLAYTKIVLAEELLKSDLSDDPFLHSDLFSYFPTAMRDEYRAQMEQHPLRREIVVTQIVNDLVNGAGITFYHRLNGETGATAEELARANIVVREICGTNALIDEINALDNTIDASAQTRMRLEVRTLAERATRWMVTNRRPPLDAMATVDFFGTTIEHIIGELPQVLRGREAELYASRLDSLVSAGVSDELARRIAVMPPAYSALGIVEICRATEVDPIEVARIHFELAERLELSNLVERILALPRDDRWQTMARAALRDDLHVVHNQLTSQVLATTSPDDKADARVADWETGEQVVVSRARDTLKQICDDDKADLARLSVGLRVVRTLVSAGRESRAAS
jgi:glutamate dehydrogenase